VETADKDMTIADFNVILFNIQPIQQLYFRARKVNWKGRKEK